VHSSNVEEYYMLQGLDNENFGLKRMNLYLKKPAEMWDHRGLFWDNEKTLVLYVVRLLQWSCSLALIL
jgi:hypothetical protein